ncbi:MAG: tetratricopeptide repeat protein [Actinobacteria bacterium]|nr:tetratricopeptide repeat protein [Actinomycetota bacterium]
MGESSDVGLGRGEIDLSGSGKAHPSESVNEELVGPEGSTKTYQPRRQARRSKIPAVLAPTRTDRLIKRLVYLLAIAVVAFIAYYAYGNYQSKSSSVPLRRISPELEKYVREHPRDLAGRLNLANAYLNQGYYNEAIEQYNQALKLNKKEQSSVVGIGLAYMKKNDDDKALEYFEKGIEMGGKEQYAKINPVLESAYYYAGTLWFKKAHYDKALDYLRQAAYIKSGSSDTYMAIGRVLVEKKDYKAAIVEFERALNFDPNYADAHYGLGLCFEKLERKDEALMHYKKALQISSDFRLAREAVKRLEKK